MPNQVSELDRRIKAKLKELGDDKEVRQKRGKLLHQTEVKIEDLRNELPGARKRIQRCRAAVAEVIGDLEELEAKTPDEDTPEEAELRKTRDELAGELDEAIAIRDRILDRLDRLQEKREDAKEALRKAVEESAEDREALQRMRERRKRRREAAKKPSEHFNYDEFDCNDGTPHPKESEPAIDHWCKTVGEPLRTKYGSVHINSAHRHRAYNARIGGEDNSVHIYDFLGRRFLAVAVDFTCERGTPAEWYAFLAGKADGRGRYNTFVHADNRNRFSPSWPDATWSG